MPRVRSLADDDLLARALGQFWQHGYYASSIDALVKVTGANRAAIYGAFGGKDTLFLKCFETYRDTVVTPAFAPVEAEDARLAEVLAYWLRQIDLAAKAGLPGPGCFVANAATEVAPHDARVRAAVAAHNARLHAGFARVLARAGARRTAPLAELLVAFTTGLWTASRLTSDAGPLRASAHAMHTLLTRSLT
jgi:TetR/AcrR family transcriptional repressor of nem operon